MAAATPRISYGFDAPGIMWGFLGAGAAAVLAGLGLAFAASGWMHLLGAALGVLGLVPLGLGITMVVYGLRGKQRMRDYMLGRIDWRGDEQVLDIGTGLGLLLIGAAKKLGPRGRADGIDMWRSKDLSDNSLDRLAENVAVAGVENRIALHTADARRLPFPDASFDVVLSLYCIHNIEEAGGQRAALVEAARVLKPGGRVLIGEWLPTHAYATMLREAGLGVRDSGTHFATALAPMWLVDAEKPAAAELDHRQDRDPHMPPS